EVDRRVLADRGMRAAAGLDADDPLRRERFVAHQELRVFLGIDVVRDHCDVVALAQRAAQRERQRRLARADRTADADAQAHERKRREYCVSWRDERIASPGVKFASSSSSIVATSCAI